MYDDVLMDVTLGRGGHISRRRFLRLSGLGLAASGLLGRISLRAEELRKQNRACILVWLGGGPSQLDTFDPKPKSSNSGETKGIATSVPGVQFAHFWPKLAAQMKEVTLLRAMVGKEAAHERATYRLHTGKLMSGAIKHPNFGSLVAHKLGDPKSDIPNFVSVGQTISSGFLGVNVAPFVVDNPGQLPANTAMRVPKPAMQRRLALLKAQDEDFARAGAEGVVKEHQTLYDRAARLMWSPRLKAFQLAGESEATKQAYGKNRFGTGLLVARRLVEAGVPFVEVRHGGWDMHNDVFKRMARNAAVVDQGVAQLLVDLKQRGLLERTFVIIMGEFGRTPKINNRPPVPGRDHWSRNFCVMMAGAGVRPGQVIGQTDDDGQEIVDGAVTVEDLFRSWCHAMGIDADEEIWTPIGRPITVVDGGQVIPGLFG